MIKKIAALITLAAALTTAAWAGSTSIAVSATYPSRVNQFDYEDAVFPSGTVFSGSAHGLGLANGVAFAINDYTAQVYVEFDVGAPAGQYFSNSQTSSALTSSVQAHYGASATANSSGSYAYAEIDAAW